MKFLTKAQVLYLHETMLARFGGEEGFINENSLDSALAAPSNRRGYEGAGLASCAATYAYHVTKAHAFVDGNKRIGGASAEAFVKLNGGRVDATDDELHDVILAIAASTMTRDQCDAWFSARVRESPPDEPVA